ncbi:ribonuclease R [Marinitoga piezophila KA3]|uniref:Ribonuclease R n=1 Tax=Marinitoga piezophila (strain DSM 14283 / JCM 11233 / KA3) TaxID=443254 RepID=H2J6C3_MARPK|nr:ribonuclease R [Marinitoga piezophila]AEX86271.1 ribonuclease R [Marinitoga piezophila KA3]
MVKNIQKKVIQLIEKKPLLQKEIYNKLKAKTKEERKKVRDALKEMMDNGEIYKNSKNKYCLPGKNMKIGIIEFTRRGSMAFVTIKGGEEIAITLENAKDAMHKDTVLVEIIGTWRDLPKGKVVRVLKRGMKKVVGIFEKKKLFGFIIPIDQKINTDFYVAPENFNDAKPGQVVEAEIIKYGGKNPEVKITKIIGDTNDPKVDLPIVIIKHELPEPGVFPKNVMNEALKIPNTVQDKDLKGRKDFRDEIIFTIDGDTAKDFDDAVQIKKLDNGNYLLGVHIADVSHYVKENSNLDKEAFKRGTSVYLIDTVIPMLPHELSDWICSLVENEDRLTMSLLMEIDENGDVVDFNVYNGVIRSKKRLTYSKVNKLLSNEADEELEKEIGWLRPQLEMMKELMEIIRENRRRRGAILDIEGGEVKFIFDENGNVKDIIPVERGISEVIIEEFMIKANETIASIFDSQGLPFIYRIHEEPDPDMLLQLKNYLEIIGLRYRFPKNIHPKLLQDLLEHLKDHPLKKSIQKLLVRSLKRAVYSDLNVGHFGLASENYTHFTSPIRRYPDLIVHRLLKKYLKGKGTLSKKDIEKYTEKLPEIASHSSKRERVANEAEWDLADMKKVEYILDHMNEIFEVYITNVTKFGLFVEIPDKFIQGLVHVSSMDDYYVYNEKLNVLVGDRKKKVYKLGDKIKVRVKNANKLTAEIDFEIVDKTDEEMEKELKGKYPNAKIKVKRKKKKNKK